MRGKKAKAIHKAAARHDVDARFVRKLAKRFWKNGPVSGVGPIAALARAIMNCNGAAKVSR